jgi:hypothetical protein
VRLTHKNERLEMHGEDEVLACDLDFEYETANHVLSEFHPDLRGIMYKRPDGVQGELVDGDLTALRLPELGMIKFAGSHPKCELVFSKGQKKHLVFADAKVGKFRFDCKDGGTVIVLFQASVYPDEGQSGKLSSLLIDKHCLLTITPAEVAQRPLSDKA